MKKIEEMYNVKEIKPNQMDEFCNSMYKSLSEIASLFIIIINWASGPSY